MGAPGLGLDNLRSVFGARVDHQVGAHLAGEAQLLFVDVDGDYLGVEDILGVLQGQVAQAAEAVDGNPLSGANVGDLHCLVSGHASAGHAAGGS
ncbi:hypothetical protein D3C77_520020 [compost metagenome]